MGCRTGRAVRWARDFGRGAVATNGDCPWGPGSPTLARVVIERIVSGAGTVVARALPGPWRRGVVLREGSAALLVGLVSGGLGSVGADGPVPGTVIGLGAALLFLLRRGLPGLALVGAAIGSGTLGSWLPLLMITSWSAGRRIARARHAVALFLLSFVLMTAVSLLTDLDEMPLPALIGVGVGGFLLLAVLPAVFGRYRAQRGALLIALQERNEQLLRERAMIARQARLRERHRIAQDMHDSLGHQLALISVHTGALEVDRSLTQGQREAVTVLRQAAVGAMRELRGVVGLLRDESTGEPQEVGGIGEIERLTGASRAAGTEVTLSRTGGVRELTPATGHAAYRIVQEALTNAHKHAPGAPIGVALRYEPDALLVEVVNGAGTATPTAAVSGGQGLTGLRERTRLLGGMLHAGPAPDGGYRLAGVLPYDGSGGPVTEDDPDLPAAPAEELPRRRPALGCAVVVAGVLLSVLGLLLWGGVKFFESLDRATLPDARFDSFQVGQSEAEIRAQLPPGSHLMTNGYPAAGPAVPAGADCAWFTSDHQPDQLASSRVSRLCFRDGVLVEKVHYRADD
ncbi:histidine kinase [Kitasatospora sp. CMC57]|uniref:histidine kinase n=1 Tax=Kitasatospora sp. CMC57 TaxID=3231513 RepID=A0AB33JM67_9ACTN